MPVERTDTLIVGGGQAGLAMSGQLRRRGCPHLVVERHRVVERWRSERWDGLHANGPAWSDCLADFPFRDVDPDAFATRDQVVAYFLQYAAAIAAPVRCGVNVTALRRLDGGAGFLAETSQGPIEARNVVAATGPFQRGVIPAIVPPEAGVAQIHSSGYRNPAQLPDGAVLVVGAAASGAQIACELMRAGRRVILSVGRHARPPRRYRGRDLLWWQRVLGILDTPAGDPPPRHVAQAFSGAEGGRTIDYRRLAAEGLLLVGRAEAFGGGVMRFADDLARNLADGDAAYLALLDQADAYVARQGLELPDEPQARAVAPDPPCVTAPVRALDLRGEGIGAIVWATGYALDFGWIDIPVLDARGRPRHRRGVSDVPGLYFLGLSWLSRRASAFIFGVGADAADLADRIAGAAADGHAGDGHAGADHAGDGGQFSSIT